MAEDDLDGASTGYGMIKAYVLLSTRAGKEYGRDGPGLCKMTRRTNWDEFERNRSNQECGMGNRVIRCKGDDGGTRKRAWRVRRSLVCVSQRVSRVRMFRSRSYKYQYSSVPVRSGSRKHYRPSDVAATTGDGGLSTILGILSEREGACDMDNDRASGVGVVGLLYGLPPGVRRPRYEGTLIGAGRNGAGAGATAAYGCGATAEQNGSSV